MAVRDESSWVDMIGSFIVGAILSGALSSDCARRAERADAISAGVGRYEADPRTGDARFVYGNPVKAIPTKGSKP